MCGEYEYKGWCLNTKLFNPGLMIDEDAKEETKRENVFTYLVTSHLPYLIYVILIAHNNY